MLDVAVVRVALEKNLRLHRDVLEPLGGEGGGTEGNEANQDGEKQRASRNDQ